MYKNILVCIDGSPECNSVIDAAIWLAQKYDSTLHGLHVLDIKAYEGPLMYDISGALAIIPEMNFMTEVKRIVQERGQVILDNFRDRCSVAGVKTKEYLLSGTVVRTIVKESEKYDLCVMGRYGIHHQLTKELLGPTTDRVIRKTTRPTLVITKEFSTIKNPMIAFDDSPESYHLIGQGAHLADSLGTPLTILHITSENDEKQPKGNEIIQKAKELMEAHNIKPNYELISGDPYHDIGNYAKDHKHDLIIIGVHRHRGIREFILGTTTEYVLWSASCHLLIAK